MTSVLAPVLPHLAEEIHDCLRTDKQDTNSFFTTKWTPLVCNLPLINIANSPDGYRIQSSEWNDPQADQDMNGLLNVRGSVLSLLEKARGNKYVYHLILQCKTWTHHRT